MRQKRRLKRYDWYHENHRLDPETDYLRITQIIAAHEFPWDMSQALGLALYRTYAVPSIGRLLDETGEFTQRTQRRYDDTALILDAIMEHGFSPGKGRDAIRRMNQMHRSYDISDEDYRYVLSTFVVMPVRWINDWGFGWRPLTDHEIAGHTNYYRTLGKHMGIKNIPADYAEFRALMDDYEREHFAYTPGGRRVSDATLDLMVDFYPRSQRPIIRPFSMALLDDSLIKAFRYDPPSGFWRFVAKAGLRTRARIVRFLPPRVEPHWARMNPNIRSYPQGYDVTTIGTFPKGCPVPHGLATDTIPETGARVPKPQPATEERSA